MTCQNKTIPSLSFIFNSILYVSLQIFDLLVEGQSNISKKLGSTSVKSGIKYLLQVFVKT